MTAPVTRKAFPFHEFEPRWQKTWDERKSFRARNPGEPGFDATRPKFYVLDMFPYPSGDGLHVGHPEGYTATDIVARYKRKKGFNVLHPMGWDAFGLPAEQYAIKNHEHPRVTTERNVGRFRAQLKQLGFAYDWDREVNTTDPEYYKWTQWIFLQLYHSWFNPASNKAEPIATFGGDDPDSVRLAYVADMPVWWCQQLGTVLANEEVVDGKSEVGGFPVERRPMRQWMLRITAFAERLIDELDGLDWPDGIKARQRDWIGRSEGAEVDFKLAVPHPEPRSADDGTIKPCSAIRVFTTRPDTLYGATYMVLAPEHPLVDAITTPAQRDTVEAYKRASASKSELDRGVAKEKTGVPTGGFAINPVNNERIPVWIADYVLMGYGTGAIMAVPAHDERDWEFAVQFGLPIIEVVFPERPTASAPCESPPAACFVGDGWAVNSPLFDGLPTPEAKACITRWLEEHGLGRKCINYRLRDWLFARQRYWGEPFPIVWENGRHRPVPESDLPIVPPDLEDFKPTGTIDPPLSKATEWVRYSDGARRELNTMPQWAGSCWYYLRYCDSRNRSRFVGREAERYWMTGSVRHSDAAHVKSDAVRGGVDLYVGGTEHAVLHLLYSRFWHKVLFDLGHVSTSEPFQKLVNQGLILGEDGQKMSKSRGNVINPDRVVDEFGADSLRLFEMFMGPLENTKPWSTQGVEGVYRFLGKVWRLVIDDDDESGHVTEKVREAGASKALLKVLHATIKKVSEDCEALSFNTAIAQMMVCCGALKDAEPRPLDAVVTFLHVLNPYAPHLTEELYARLRGKFPQLPNALLSDQPWPEFDERHLVESEIEIVVQVNGKLRDRVLIPAESGNPAHEHAALASAKIQEHIAGKTVRKVIVVPKKLVNIVAN